jgi:hypothetical protein
MEEASALAHAVASGFRSAVVGLNPVGEAFRGAVIPLVSFLGVMHLGVPLILLVLSPPAHSGVALVEVELGAAIRVASMIFLASPACPRR